MTKLANGAELLGQYDGAVWDRDLGEIWTMYSEWVLGRVHFEKSVVKEDHATIPEGAYKHPFDVKLALLGSMGLAAEAAEVLDEHKKLMFHGSDYQIKRAKIVEELGDMFWYVVPTMKAHGITLEEVLSGNVDKLVKKDGVNSERFHERAKSGL